MAYYIVSVSRPTSFTTKDGEVMMSPGNPHKITEEQYEEIVQDQPEKMVGCIFTRHSDVPPPAAAGEYGKWDDLPVVDTEAIKKFEKKKPSKRKKKT